MKLPSQEIRRLKMIKPFREEQLQPASYDLKLDCAEKEDIMPGESMLGVTQEVVTLPPNISATVYGKSSIAREFLQVHCAGFIDPGFSGQIVLEFTNNSDRPIRFDKYDTICQITFEEMKEVPDKLYNGHYQDQRGITQSWMKDEKVQD